MSRVEYRSLANVRHEYLLPIPCNINEMAEMLEHARGDREAAGLPVGGDDDLMIVTEETVIIGYWDQEDFQPQAPAYDEGKEETLAQLLATNAGYKWDQIPEEGHAQYRGQAKSIFEELNSAG